MPAADDEVRTALAAWRSRIPSGVQVDPRTMTKLEELDPRIRLELISRFAQNYYEHAARVPLKNPSGYLDKMINTAREKNFSDYDYLLRGTANATTGGGGSNGSGSPAAAIAPDLLGPPASAEEMAALSSWKGWLPPGVDLEGSHPPPAQAQAHWSSDREGRHTTSSTGPRL